MRRLSSFVPHPIRGLRPRSLRREGSVRRFTSDRVASAPPPDPHAHDFYGAAIVGAGTIGARALEASLLAGLTDELVAADRDEYVAYVAAFTEAGAARSGAAWRYADITTLLAAATELLRPTSYLEIGVRRGRSMAVVARRAPACALLGVDFWNPGYAGIDNPGEAHVRGVIAATGHTGQLELISGDSHKVVPALFAERPAVSFDLITVDGDHSARGARADIETVVSRLRIGGALVFDDISHPVHPYLHRVWEDTIVKDRRFATWSFDDVGYGVAVAVRRW